MQLSPLEQRVLAAGQGRDAELPRARKKSEGIVHTPPELARFLARAADELVQRELGVAGGLADPSVALIDPACGPGAFLAAAHAVAGGRASSPAVALGLDRDAAALERCRTAFADAATQRWPVVLRCEDTLQQSDPVQLAALGQHVVVLGNPPWIGSAQAKASPRIEALLEELRRDEDGVRLVEKKLGVLADAYVRFLAFALAIARAARGGALVGLVTNASYLDGPVHRGLRGALSRAFDALHVIDLGGSALLARERRAPDGNVFGVRTPAALLLAVRRPEGEAPRGARVRYARVHGDVASKLEQLSAAGLEALSFQPVEHTAPLHRFVPVRAAPLEYARWPSLAELMPFHREGVQTNRDAAVVDVSAERLIERLAAFVRGEARAELADAERALPHYDPERAREALRRALDDAGGRFESLVQRIAYRPLDTRFFVPIAPLCHRPRADLLKAMRASSFALVVARKDRSAVPWRHVAATAEVLDNSFLSARSSCRARGVPTHDPDGAENLDRTVAAELMARAGRPLSAHEIACYALAQLSSPAYQERYLPWLRADYPRVPLPESAAAFERALRHGEQLRAAWCEPIAAPPHGAAAAASSAPSADLIVGHHRVLERLLKARSPSGGQNDRASAPHREAVRARAALLAALLAFQA